MKASGRKFIDTASKVPVCEDLAKTTKVTQLTTNGTDNRVHNVAPSFIIINGWAFNVIHKSLGCVHLHHSRFRCYSIVKMSASAFMVEGMGICAECERGSEQPE